MTMPHLENCGHSEEGWCLACVKQLGEENIALRMTVLAVSQITMESVYESGRSLDDEPDSIMIAKGDIALYRKAARLVLEACRKWQI